MKKNKMNKKIIPINNNLGKFLEIYLDKWLDASLKKFLDWCQKGIPYETYGVMLRGYFIKSLKLSLKKNNAGVRTGMYI